VRKIGEHELTDAFSKVIEDLKIFAMPMLSSIARGEKLSQRWNAKNGWLAQERPKQRT
jgi:hypothetical protein